MLEPENVRRFVDEHLQFPIDATQVMWVLSVNSTAEVFLPILDRLTILEVGDMERPERVAVLRTVYSDLVMTEFANARTHCPRIRA